MNAIFHEECEAPVLTNEAIEVHLSYLRPSVEAVKAELPELRKEIKALDEKLSGKIDAVDEKLSGEISALDERLSGKFESLADRLMKVQASQDGLKWFISTLALIVSGVSIARSLGWI
jgi:chromosome segregation ATPase